MYREFNNLTNKGPMTINQQLDRLRIFHSQIEKASTEGLLLSIGDMNIDLEKWEDPMYYLKNLAEEYQSLIGECGLEIIDFGITLSREHRNRNSLSSAIDNALTNKPMSIKSYHKTCIDYSDHNMISVDLDINIPKVQERYIESRDLRKLRKNPEYFLRKLATVKWELLSNLKDVDAMEIFWTNSIIECLDSVWPFP